MPNTAITRFAGPHAFLSNFHHSRFRYDGISWPTAEHAYQAMKLADPQLRFSCALIETPAGAKRQGRRYELRHDWEAVKRRIMLEIVLAKFEGNGELRDRLAQTAPAVLIEGNGWGDTYWGAVECGPAGLDGLPLIWTGGHPLAGRNWLGRVLMMAREVLG